MALSVILMRKSLCNKGFILQVVSNTGNGVLFGLTPLYRQSKYA